MKYELTNVSKVNEWGIRVHQIRATEDIPRFGVKKGDLGGWLETVEVFGAARVSGAACPIGSESVTATLYRTANGKHRLHVGCWEGTLGTLMAEVKRRRVGWVADEGQQDLWMSQYRALTALGKATVARWGEGI